MNEDTTQGLYDELYRLQDAVQEVDPTNPYFESTVEYLEGCIDHVLEELELAGEEV